MTAPTAEALEQRAREVWDMRPLGSAFWDELPPLFRDQLTRLYVAGVAAERERAAGVCLAVSGLIGATNGSSIDSALCEAAAAIRQEPKP